MLCSPMGLLPATSWLVSGGLCKTFLPKHISLDSKQALLLSSAELELDLILVIIKVPLEQNFSTLWGISIPVFCNRISTYISP